jgi:hypothetical protein
MKTLLSIVLIVMLTGCATTINKIDRYINPPKFDGAEYATLVGIRQLAEQKEMCEDPQDMVNLASALRKDIDWAVKYSEQIKHNEEANKMFVAMRDEADRFVEHARKKANPTYCRLKLENMVEQAVIIQRAEANK